MCTHTPTHICTTTNAYTPIHTCIPPTNTLRITHTHTRAHPAILTCGCTLPHMRKHTHMHFHMHGFLYEEMEMEVKFICYVNNL